MSRYVPHVVVRDMSVNHSSRGGVKPRLIVLHSTESDNRTGNGDLAAVAAYLGLPSTQASAHVIVDADGHSARLVRDEDKAWHCVDYNSVGLGIEQIGRARQTHWTRDEIREAARWCARWSRKFGIPLTRAEVSGGRVIKPGVIRHMDLGLAGGGHVDPGPPYPIEATIHLARFYAARL